MISSLVKAGMRAITPRSKKNDGASDSGSPTERKDQSPAQNANGNDVNGIVVNISSKNGAVTSLTTPKGMAAGSCSQATIPTPSTASTVDITANNTTFNTTMDSGAQPSKDLCRSLLADSSMDANNDTRSTSVAVDEKPESEKTSSDPEGRDFGPCPRHDEKESDCQATHTETEKVPPTSIVTATATASSSAKTDDATTSPSELWKVLDRQLRSNIGTSVRCGICLSTVSDPVRTQCCHGFCRECITGYLRASGSNKCPECNAFCTRRSLESFEQLDDLADAYKGMLRAFGLAPGTYRPEITTMTQKVDFGRESGGSDSDDDDGDSERARLDRLCVAKTYELEALPLVGCSKLQVNENHQIVAANFEACFEDEAVDPETMGELLENLVTERCGVGKSGRNNDPKPSQRNEDTATTGVLPNTQEVQEQAREQLEADREMQENSMEDEEELEKLLRLTERQTEESTATNPLDRDSQETTSERQINVCEKQSAGSQLFATASQGEDFLHDDPTEELMRDGLADAASEKPSTSPNKNETRGDIFGGPPPSPPPELPAFARIDNGIQNRRHTRKSFSRHDRRNSTEKKSSTPPPPSSIEAGELFEADSLSPIDHETSYWAEDSSHHFAEDPGNDVTGMMEDSRGGMHMMPLTIPRDHSHSQHKETDNEVDGSDSSAGRAASGQIKNGGGRGQDDGSNGSNSGTPSFEENADKDRNHENDSALPPGSNGGSGDDEESSDKTIPMTAEDRGSESDSSSNGSSSLTSGVDEPTHYDSTKLTQVTEELHESTKLEIEKASTLPAGPKTSGRRQLPSKKKLFEAGEIVAENGGEEGPIVPNDNSGFVTYDPTKLTQVTEELHESTKEEIKKAASLPAGPRPRGCTKKILFAVDDDGSSKKRPSNDTAKRSTARTKSTRITSLGGVDGNDSKPAQEGEETQESSSAIWTKGTIVRVQSRTWPGVNKPGGVGRIMAINSDGTYNVAYVLGGKESNIDKIFIQKEDQGDSESGEPGSGGVQVRRRRRAKENDTADLPEELLRQLAEEGFDVPGQKGGKKRKKNNRTALSDNTNSENGGRRNLKKPPKKNNTATRTNTGGGSKRKRSTPSSDSGAIPTNTVQQTARPKRKGRSTSRDPPSSTNKASNAKSAKADDLPNTVVKKYKKSVSFAEKESEGNVTRKTSSGASRRATKDQRRESNVSPFDFLLRIPNEEAVKLANRRYHLVFQEAIDNKLITVASSNLKDEDKAILKSLCAKTFEGGVKIKVTESVSRKTTLCIVPAENKEGDKANIQSGMRTLKIMLSALAGIPIVTPDWLRSCYVESKVVRPQRFVRSMPTKNKAIENCGGTNYGVAKLAASWNTKPKAPALPFRKTFVYFCGSYTVDNRKYMQDLLKAGGAKVLLKPADISSKLKSLMELNPRSFSPTSDRLVILCGGSGTSLPKSLEKDLKATLERNELSTVTADSPPFTIVVDFQWVIESVACAKPMPAAFFEPKICKNLWKLCPP